MKAVAVAATAVALLAACGGSGSSGQPAGSIKVPPDGVELHPVDHHRFERKSRG